MEVRFERWVLGVEVGWELVGGLRRGRREDRVACVWIEEGGSLVSWETVWGQSAARTGLTRKPIFPNWVIMMNTRSSYS